jgi:uncharacterized membrane protein (DUF2068 family)
MTGSLTLSAHRRGNHRAGLVLIAAYKLLVALFFIAVGVGALRLVHKDVDDVVSQIMADLKFNPESRFVNFVLDKAALLNDHMLRRVGLGAFVYAGLGILEAIGLYLEKTWGEYLTLFITASFLPFEIHELMFKISSVRVGLLVVNLLVLVYLLKIIFDGTKRKQR